MGTLGNEGADAISKGGSRLETVTEVGNHYVRLEMEYRMGSIQRSEDGKLFIYPSSRC